MKGPKIMVFHIRQLLKTGAFVLAGLLIILLLIWVLSPKDNTGQTARGDGQSSGATGMILSAEDAFSNVLYIPGSYSSIIVLDDNNVFLTVDVDAFNITDIRMTNMAAAQRTLYPLFVPVLETLRHDILLNQTTDVTPPEAGPLTGQILLEAINIALGQAYVNVITTVY